jgi:hypothetical protein
MGADSVGAQRLPNVVLTRLGLSANETPVHIQHMVIRFTDI